METFLEIKPNGQITEHTDVVVDLEFMQTIAGGKARLIELVRINEDLLMWVPEEGLIEGLPLNEIASQLAGGQYIVGTALVTANDEDVEGNMKGVPERYLEQFRMEMV